MNSVTTQFSEHGLVHAKDGLRAQAMAAWRKVDR